MAKQMWEKELYDDVLASQKFMTGTYNTYANECATPGVRDEFLHLLTEEHKIQADVFDEIKNRGWYQAPQAERQRIQQAKVRFTNAAPNH